MQLCSPFAWFRSLALYRRTAALVCLLTALIVGGCMNFQVSDDGLLTQEGQITLQPNQVVDICYALPYATAPQLEIIHWSNKCPVLEEKEDHFRIRNDSGSPREMLWKARGPRSLQPVARNMPGPGRPTGNAPKPVATEAPAKAAPPAPAVQLGAPQQ